MKIAFIITKPVLSSSDGVVAQMKSWSNRLTKLGHQVDFISQYQFYDWQSYDIIHIFVFSEFMAEYINWLYPVNQNIVVSPILDTTYSRNAIKLLSHWGNEKLRLHNKYYCFREIKEKIKMVSARSEFERSYMIKSFGFTEEQVKTLPLSYGDISFSQEHNTNRENYCFHMSFLADRRKNVKRLIEASAAYDFPLKLAGRIRNHHEEMKIEKWLSHANKAEYIGFLTEEEKVKHYQTAKVFALPSVNEGVGLVALEAAINGANIVITNFGGPQEYYVNLAKKVDPYSIDDIGKAVRAFLDGETYQPKLKKHILDNYSLETTMTELVKQYQEVIQSKYAKDIAKI